MWPLQGTASLPAPTTSSTSHAYQKPPYSSWHIALPWETACLESGPIEPAATFPVQVKFWPKNLAIAFEASPGVGGVIDWDFISSATARPPIDIAITTTAQHTSFL